MRTLSSSLLCLVAAACVTDPAVTEDAPPTAETTADGNRVLRSGEWKWVIRYRAKGTRSEGQHGELYFHGLRITDGRIGEVRETPFGTLEYYGTDAGGKPWSPTGWNYADPDLIRASWQTEDPGGEDR